jgi:hypothetical protein
MWPFTGKRIFGSRWWAIAFVLFVCWQVAIFASPTESDDAPLNVAQVQEMTDAFNKM